MLKKLFITEIKNGKKTTYHLDFGKELLKNKNSSLLIDKKTAFEILKIQEKHYGK